MNINEVRGRCYVQYIDMSVSNQEIETWSQEGPDRCFLKEFEEPPLTGPLRYPPRLPGPTS